MAIKTHYRAVRKGSKDLEVDKKKSIKSLKEDIEAEIVQNEQIDIRELTELLQLDHFYREHDAGVDVEEIMHHIDAAVEIEEFRKIFRSLSKNFGKSF